MSKLKILLLFISVFSLSCSKKDDGGKTTPQEALPTVKIAHAIVHRDKDGSVCRFYIDLNPSFSKKVSVKYVTEDGSAKSKTDYEPQSGTLAFPVGTTELSLDIPIIGDSLRQPKQYFYVKLSDPVNCTIETGKGKGTIINNNGIYLPTDNAGYTTTESYAGYHLAWSDEFNEKELNENFWNYETGTGSNGWGNNELEYYTSRPENIFLSSGNLIIEARKEEHNGSLYTSARITTQNKKEFTYGRIDIRAKLPVDQGLWPALWMLGSNISSVGWPQCGETDIMEVIGKNPSQVVGSLHWKKSNGAEAIISKTHTLPAGDFSDKFHVFSLEWSKDSLVILVDDIPYMKAYKTNITDGIYPFYKPFFFIFNVAVGGNWPGSPDNTTSFPQRMFVDYVRVFQKN